MSNTTNTLILLDENFFAKTCKIAILLCLIGFSVNTFFVHNYATSLLIFSGGLSILLLYLLRKFIPLFLGIFILFFIGFVIVNAFWFLSAGVHGAALIIFIVYTIILLTVLPINYYNYFLLLIIINILILVAVESFYPNLLFLHSNNSSKTVDLITSAITTLIITTLSLHFFKKKHYLKQDIIEAQNQDLINSQEALRLAKEKAETANFNKSSFLAMMSHEVRTPLNAIIGISNLLQEHDYQDQQKEKLVDALQTSSQLLLGLLNNILDFNIIESGNIKLQLEATNLRELLISLNEIYQPLAKNNKNTLSINIAPNVPEYIIIDNKRLQQIIEQLLSNAIKFTSKGIVSVGVSSLSFVDNNVELSFEVKDTGNGLSTEVCQQLVHHLNSNNLLVQSANNSFGLGLAITNNLLKLMGSQINVESNPNLGSCFYFKINCAVAPSPNKIDTNPAIGRFSRPLNFLLVEDNKTNVLVLTHFLKRWNISFVVAYNGLEALEIYQKQDFDLILMDMQMPKMDGFEATEKIRATNTTIPIIALTASATQEEKNKALQAGVNEYITKPFEPEQLYRIFKKYLDS